MILVILSDNHVRAHHARIFAKEPVPERRPAVERPSGLRRDDTRAQRTVALRPASGEESPRIGGGEGRWP